MKKYILDSESGRLYSANGKKSENAEASMYILSAEEFSAEKISVPPVYKSNLIRNMKMSEYCRLEFFGNRVQGTMHITQEASERGAPLDFGFLMTDTVLYIIGNADALIKVADKLPDCIYSTASINRVLLAFFELLLEDDVICIQRIEKALGGLEEELIENPPPHFYETLLLYNKRISALHAYYEQIMEIGDLMLDRIDPHSAADEFAAWQHYSSRTERLHNHVQRLSDYLVQLRELYQAQISERQNNIMTLLTVITTIFLPLTLIAGWYGMNFAYMPELKWQYGYPVIIGLSVLIIAGEIIYFKKKKML